MISTNALSAGPLRGRLVGTAAALLVTAASHTAFAQCPDEAPYYCSDGYCYDIPCESVTSCPDSTPYECSDGYCYDIPCESVTSCPDSSPYECSDGYCYDVPCESVSTCPDSAPYECSDGYCYETSDCSACPPGYPYDCGNGYCGDVPQACDGEGETAPAGTPSAPGPGSGSGSGSGEEYCAAVEVVYEGCDSVQACCTTTGCRYLTDDGTSFYCNAADCSAAAQETLDYCEEQTGCSASSGPARGGPGGILALLALALGAAVRSARGRR